MGFPSPELLARGGGVCRIALTRSGRGRMETGFSASEYRCQVDFQGSDPAVHPGGRDQE